jgi:SAM-dependent methyltransferase
MDWEEAGRGWGERAREWAYLFEPYSLPANELILRKLEVGPGTRLLDVACGSGYAARLAALKGAEVAGIDAAAPLIEIARLRSPESDFRVGDMFALPFNDGSFDRGVSFNGIWKGCEAALTEVRRVLIDGGVFGMTFWGRYANLGLLPYFLKIIEHSPQSHGSASVEQGDTGRPGVIEGMLEATGFHLLERGEVTVTNEWPDVATAVRALAAAGPSVPAIETIGYDQFCEELNETLTPRFDQRGGLRVSSEFGWVTAARH